MARHFVRVAALAPTSAIGSGPLKAPQLLRIEPFWGPENGDRLDARGPGSANGCVQRVHRPPAPIVDAHVSKVAPYTVRLHRHDSREVEVPPRHVQQFVKWLARCWKIRRRTTWVRPRGTFPRPPGTPSVAPAIPFEPLQASSLLLAHRRPRGEHARLVAFPLG